MSATAYVPAPETSEALASVEERRALIERIAASAHFGRSARLRDFLLYVGGQSLKEGCPEIHEQEIGAKVFGRPSSYDRSQDNIVRVNATELRKRIDLYFATEGAHEPLILEIPRGGYKPVFHWRLPEVESPAEETPLQPLAQSTQRREPESAVLPSVSRAAHLWWAAVSLVLAIACVVLLQQNRTMHKELSPSEGKPALAAFWTEFLRYHQQTDVVLPDDSVSVIQDIIHHPISLEDYLTRDYMRQIQSSDVSVDRRADLDQIYVHNLITFGGVRAAQQMLAQIPASPAPHLTLSRYYTADAMKRNNVILVGGKKANPWVHLFDDQMNFITDYDHEHDHAFVGNLHPKPGEQATYAPPIDPNALVGYSVVAYLPNPSKTGNAIILAGTDSDATSAAAEFLTSEDQLERLRNTLHVQKFPYFEVLLKTYRLSGTSFNAEPVAYRTYPEIR
ncbi:hypothetical protein [Granulicella sp. S156]|jgi:hypothetical protein|uniref:hypothetical protein n=1 Tax=Granulicella sp. S156 TaxID=1747224 RepID=UPI0020B16C95|nr:hypothetical protein [Granulicella sp. S156]